MKSIGRSNKKGFTLIEVIIAAAVGVFLLFTVFYMIGNILSKAILTEKKVELVSELDSRVDEFMLTGEFDDSELGDMTFVEGLRSGSVFEFAGSNSDFSLNIIKRAYGTASSVADLINKELGPYMAAVAKIYRDAGATRLDESPELRVLVEEARREYLGDENGDEYNTMIASGHVTNVLLNIGNTALSSTVPLDDPILDQVAALRIELRTDADVTPEGLVWHCVVVGNYDGELLPSWCVL